jgi:hypothetical protein
VVGENVSSPHVGEVAVSAAGEGLSTALQHETIKRQHEDETALSRALEPDLSHVETVKTDSLQAGEVT